MGQYYNVVIKNKDTIITYNKKVDGKYTMPKLTEHSWWYNPFVSSITKLLYKKSMSSGVDRRLFSNGMYRRNQSDTL